MSNIQLAVLCALLALISIWVLVRYKSRKRTSRSGETRRMKTRNQLKKHIFIFGAGASVECGYPLGNNLFSRACWIRDESPVEKSKSEDAQWMGKILEVVEPGMRKLSRNLPENTEDWPPLEEVLSLA